MILKVLALMREPFESESHENYIVGALIHVKFQKKELHDQDTSLISK